MEVHLLCGIFLLLLYVDFSSQITEAQLKSAAKLLRKNCQPKTKVTDESIQKMHKGDWDDAPETQCYAYCILAMYKLVDKEGRYNEEQALAQVDLLPKPRQEPTMNSAHACKEKDIGKDKCEAAYNFLKCVYFDNPDNYFIP